MAHHRGALTISGTVDRIEIERHAATMSRPPGAPPQKPTAHVCAAGVASETNGHEADGAAAAAKRVATEVRRPEGKRVAAEKAKRPEAKEAAAKPKRQKRSATEASELDAAIVRAQTKDALVSLGWTPAIATAAVSAAAATFAGDLSLERLIREALRRCPVPRS
jgi:hypothetical protein